MTLAALAATGVWGTGVYLSACMRKINVWRMQWVGTMNLRQLALLIYLLAISVCAAAQASRTAQAFQMVRDWQRAVYPCTRGSTLSICADSKQNVHVITNDGFWVTLAPSGATLRETREDSLNGALTVACADDDTVLVGVPKDYAIHVFSGDHRYLRTIRVSEELSHILSVRGGEALVLSPQREGLSLARLKLDDEHAARSPVHIGGPPAEAPSIGPTAGLLDVGKGLLILVRKNPEKIFVYKPTGELVSSRVIEGGVRPRGAEGPEKVTIRNDSAEGIFALGNRYIVNIWREDLSPALGTVASHLEYQILDDHFNVLGYAQGEGIGTILATDAQGGIYGLGGWGQPLRVIKGHLQ